MINRYNGYKAEMMQSAERLPVGAYVCKILKAEPVNYTWGSVLLVSFDICEGEYKDFYAKNYKSQTSEDTKKWKGVLRMNLPKDDGSERDEWTKRSFNNFVGVIEDANPGYHFDWDEATLKGKTVGILFRNKEWEKDGKTGFWTEPFSAASVGDIRDGKDFKIKDKLLNKETQSIAESWSVGADAAYGSDDDLPF